DGRIALGTSRERYNIESMWGEGGTDLYLIDGTTGKAKVIKENISGNAQLSPEDKYVAFFDKGRWYTYNNASGKTTDVTGGVKDVSRGRGPTDGPDGPSAWRSAGWTEGERSMLLYDRWDIWEVDPNGARAAGNVTDSHGR